MKDTLRKNSFLILIGSLFLTFIFASPSEAAVKVSYMYKLSGFTGTVPYDRGRVSIDRERNETYVLYQNTIRVFNESGMEIYQFGEELDVGHILDVAIDRGVISFCCRTGRSTENLNDRSFGVTTGENRYPEWSSRTFLPISLILLLIA